MKQIGRNRRTAIISTLIIVIPAAIAAGMVMRFPWCRSIEVFHFTFIGFAMLEYLSCWIWFRTRPDPETTEEMRAEPKLGVACAVKQQHCYSAFTIEPTDG